MKQTKQNNKSISDLICVVLFLQGRDGETIKSLAKKFKTNPKEIQSNLEELKVFLEKTDSPFVVLEQEDRVRLTVKKSVAIKLSSIIDKTINVRLSKSVLETLTIIAYQQPIIKPEVERIRGVSSDYSISKLLDFELIQNAGKSSLPGNPILYTTTPFFLELFELNSLEDLPPLPEEIEKTQELSDLFNYD